MKARAFTPKQKRFVQEYLIDMNGAAAAVRAGYSPRIAKEMAFELLRIPHIAKALADAQAKVANKLEIKAERVLQELARVAYFDLSTVIRIEGRNRVVVTPTAAQTDDQRAAVAAISETVNGISVKAHDKLKALEILAKHLGLLKEELSITGGGPLVIVVPPDDGK